MAYNRTISKYYRLTQDINNEINHYTIDRTLIIQLYNQFIVIVQPMSLYLDTNI